MIRAIFTTILFLSTTFAIGQSRKASKLLDQYLKVAFDASNTDNNPVLKWENKDTLNYRILGSFQYLSYQEWDEFIDEIEYLSNKVIIPSEGTSYDILIFIGPIDAYAEVANYDDIPANSFSKYKTWSNKSWDINYNLLSSSFCIDPSQINGSAEGAFYLKKLFLNSMGIVGNISNDYSLLNNEYLEGNNVFRKMEKRLLKLHYDDKIKAGMREEQLEKVILYDSKVYEAVVKI